MPSKWLLQQKLREIEGQRQANGQPALTVAEIEEIVMDTDPGPTEPSDPEPEREYIWVEHDNIWEVARRLNLGVNGHELLEHNGYEDEEDIAPGTVLHLPYPRQLKEEPPIRYETLQKPVTFHVSAAEGARKWSFGNIKKWDDFSKSGYYPPHTNLKIVAIAHVPVGDSDVPAAFYMDAHAFGDFQNTGKVNFTIGYAWSELTEGEYVKPPATPPPLAEQRLSEQQPDDFPEVRPGPNSYKASFVSLKEDGRYTEYRVEVDQLVIEELDGRREPVIKRNGQLLPVIGTFDKDGVAYARLGKSVTASINSGDFWWGARLDSIVPEDSVADDLFSIPVTIPQKKAVHKPLSTTEQWVDVMARTTSYYTRVAHKLKTRSKK